jgi:hypothetical protein
MPTLMKLSLDHSMLPHADFAVLMRYIADTCKQITSIDFGTTGPEHPFISDAYTQLLSQAHTLCTASFFDSAPSVLEALAKLPSL